MAKEFMLLIRSRGEHLSLRSPEKNKQFLKACEDYIGVLTKGGKLKSAQPLVREGKMISGTKGNWNDGPFYDGEEMIVGYYHILAENINEAIEIAKGNPEFAFSTTARIEVRPVKMFEESTEYVYPTHR